jgi:3-deoxy-manno-octulosonate cytidylyltransferase (CMP-KDO synthetase)
MRAVAIIPVRMGSTRFPGKPLAPLLGRPMLQWVYDGTRRSESVGATYVATCDAKIAEAASAFGAPVLMTSAAHERASDRVAEAARRFDAPIVVMVQGDEPMVTPEMLRVTVQAFERGDVVCVNLAEAIGSEAEFRDPNTIKVVTDRNGRALYFSRAPIPSTSRAEFRRGCALRQVCVIGFRASFLQTFAKLPPTPGELAESIDMLRILEHGYPVDVVRITGRSHPVDTPGDLQIVESLLRGDRACG